MMKISPLILMFTIFASSMSSYAGFADSLRDLRGTLSQINETTKEVAGTAKEMIIKLQMFLLGSIVESLTKVYLKGICGGNFCKRTAYLKDHGIISEELQTDIDWLWDMRNKMHIFQVDNSEWQSADYTVANHNRAVKAFKGLLERLNGPTV